MAFARAMSSFSSACEAAPLTKTLAEGGPNQAELRAPYTISAEGLRLPPDSSADLWLAAVDHRPGREPVVSPAYRIHILSRTRHAQLLEEMARAIQDERAAQVAAKTATAGAKPSRGKTSAGKTSNRNPSRKRK